MIFRSPSVKGRSLSWLGKKAALSKDLFKMEHLWCHIRTKVLKVSSFSFPHDEGSSGLRLGLASYSTTLYVPTNPKGFTFFRELACNLQERREYLREQEAKLQVPDATSFHQKNFLRSPDAVLHVPSLSKIFKASQKPAILDVPADPQPLLCHVLAAAGLDVTAPVLAYRPGAPCPCHVCLHVPGCVWVVSTCSRRSRSPGGCGHPPAGPDGSPHPAVV